MLEVPFSRTTSEAQMPHSCVSLSVLLLWVCACRVVDECRRMSVHCMWVSVYEYECIAFPWISAGVGSIIFQSGCILVYRCVHIACKVLCIHRCFVYVWACLRVYMCVSGSVGECLSVLVVYVSVCMSSLISGLPFNAFIDCFAFIPFLHPLKANISGIHYRHRRRVNVS